MKKTKILLTIFLVAIVLIFAVGCAEEKAHFSVNFSIDGEVVNRVEIEAGSKVTAIADPTKEGYDFLGWYLGEEKYDFDRTVDGDITLVAKFSPVTVPTPPAPIEPTLVSAVPKISPDSAHTVEFDLGGVFSHVGLIVKVELSYSDGSSEEIDVEYTVDSTACDMENAGKYTVVINTEYGAINYEITVGLIAEIRVVNMPTVTTYIEGDEINTDGITIEVEYVDGTVDYVDVESFGISSVNSGSTTVSANNGKDKVILKYGVYTAEYEVTVYQSADLAPTAIYIKDMPEVVDFATGGEFFSDGLTVEKVTAEFPARRLVMATTEYTVDFSQCDISTAGEYVVNIVSVVDGAISVSYGIKVVNAQGDIVGISATPTRTEFLLGENLDLSGLSVKLLYEDGSEVGIKSEDYSVDVSRYDCATLGTKTVTLTLLTDGTMTDSFDVEVVDNPIVGEYYEVEGACIYSIKITVENGLVKAYRYDFGLADWAVSFDENLTEMFAEIEWTPLGVKLGENAIFDTEDKLIKMDENTTFYRINSTDIVVKIDAGEVTELIGSFFLLAPGDTLADYVGGDLAIYLTYDDATGTGTLLTADYKFYESTTVYIR